MAQFINKSTLVEELTYKDIETILGIENNILHECNDKSLLVIEAYPKGEDYYGEILRRFNNQRIKSQCVINTEAKGINNVWYDTRRTIPEDGSEQIICIKEDGLAVSTVGKIVNGTIKWAYLNDLLNISDVQVKEAKEEPVSKDLEAEFILYLKHKFNIPQEGNKLKTNGWRPSPYDLLDIAKHFAQWQKEQMIDKACEWLLKNDSYAKPTELLVRDFKKAMEE